MNHAPREMTSPNTSRYPYTHSPDYPPPPYAAPSLDSSGDYSDSQIIASTPITHISSRPPVPPRTGVYNNHVHSTYPGPTTSTGPLPDNPSVNAEEHQQTLFSQRNLDSPIYDSSNRLIGAEANSVQMSSFDDNPRIQSPYPADNTGHYPTNEYGRFHERDRINNQNDPRHPANSRDIETGEGPDPVVGEPPDHKMSRCKRITSILVIAIVIIFVIMTIFSLFAFAFDSNGTSY